MSWNKSIPDGATTSVAASDNLIRDNWSFLRSAFAQEHEDPDSHPSTPANIVHKQGAGRVIVYTGATVLDSSADVVGAVSQLYHNSFDIGRVVVDQNTTATPGSVWYCVATDTFIEITRLWGALTLAGTLTANNGIVIPTTKRLQVPPAEASIYDGTNTLDPFAHAARHAGSGADIVTGLLRSNVIFKTGAGPTTTTGELLTHTFDFSGRSGNTLLVCFAWLTLFIDVYAAGEACSVTVAVQHNDTDKGTPINLGQLQGTQDTEQNLNEAGFTAAAFLVTNAAGQKIDLEFKTAVGLDAGDGIKDFGLLIFDLGALGLTT